MEKKECCTPVYQGLVHGVAVYFGEDECRCFPVVDREGAKRPKIIIKQDCSADELLEAVYSVRGRYDLSRALGGLKPFDWGPVGSRNDCALLLGVKHKVSSPNNQAASQPEEAMNNAVTEETVPQEFIKVVQESSRILLE